jgi:hypothetical protein
MKNQSKFRLLTLIGVFALLSVSLSGCFYAGYGRNHGRPAYGYSYRYRPQVRIYTPPRYYSHHDNYRRNNDNSRYGNNRNYNNRSYRSNGADRGGRSRNGRH